MIDEATHSLHPEAVQALEAHRNTPTRHAETGLRPPLGAYNISMQQVVARFVDVLRELDSVQTHEPYRASDATGWAVALLTRHESLLYALAEHLEDCQNILESFMGKTPSKAQQAALHNYRARTKPYRDFIATTVNRIKHHQRRLRALAWIAAPRAVAGYFVEGVRSDGAIGPDEQVHRDGREAFSFNRELRLHLAHLYQIGQALAMGVAEIMGDASRHAAPIDESTERLWEIASKVAALPDAYLPTELTPPFPSVAVEGAAPGTRKIKVGMGPLQGRLWFPGRGKVRVDLMGDGISESFKFPFLGGAKIPAK